MQKILLITPPLTQLNTPYPATAYLKGFLGQLGYAVWQADLGIELVNSLFTARSLRQLFEQAAPNYEHWDENAQRIFAQRAHYLRTVDAVLRFLQGHDSTMAQRICTPGFLPQAARFAQEVDLDWAFGSLGLQDRARFLATRYIEDLGDFIRHTTSPGFAFTRYAEQIARTAVSFDPLADALTQAPDFIDTLLLQLLQQHLQEAQPDVVGFSVPFPGNLFGALRCGQYIRQHWPQVKLVLGGGYANTELRSLTEPRVFDFVDYICLDDGEAPLLQLLRFWDGQVPFSALKRTYYREKGQVCWADSDALPDFEHADVGTPDYAGLKLDTYLSVIEMANPMHRLWSDGRWNKLTLAHGCYWHRCTFCDTTLDYIKRVSETSATVLVDRMEAVMRQTGQSGFHFTDEAAPPFLLRDLSLEILRRNLVVSWWTNIRFEKNFTPDLARLMAAAGCIAVSGGLEVASDRLLKLIKKGTNLKQVTKATHAFKEAGIMVHAYLMYGFPTQTAQETIDSLEMVRQLFALELLQSAYWHLFTMTVHSPIGLQPELFQVQNTGPGQGSFANNDLFHLDPTGTQHERFGAGLNAAVYNYMHAVQLERPVHEWFDFRAPRTSAAPTLLQSHLDVEPLLDSQRTTERILWLGTPPTIVAAEAKKGKETLLFQLPTGARKLRCKSPQARWIVELVQRLEQEPPLSLRLADLATHYTDACGEDFLPFLFSKEWQMLRVAGLLLLR